MVRWSVWTLTIACLALSIHGQAQNCSLPSCVCAGQTIPSGDIITQVQTIAACGTGVNNADILKYIGGDPSDAQETACVPSPIPSDWAVTDTPINTACGNNNTGNARSLLNLRALPIGQVVDVCQITDINNLPGWQITIPSEHVTGRCGDTPTVAAGMKIQNFTNAPPPPPPPSRPPGIFEVLQWGAQDPSIGHQIGHANSDGSWGVSSGSQGWLSYGPYTQISTPGDYVAAWDFSVASNPFGPGFGNIDVNDATTQTQIAVRNPALAEFTNINTFQTLTLPFSIDSTRAGHQFEFRNWWFANAPATEGRLGYVPLQWNALTGVQHVIGREDDSTGFPGWSASVGDGANWLQYGPYVTLSQPGIYVALWTLQIDFNYNDGINEVVAIVDINDATTQTRLASLQIFREDFLADNTDQVFQVTANIDSTRAGHQFEFRIWWNDFAYIREQAVGVVKVQ